MSSSSLFRGFGDTGPARGAHGAAAPAQVAFSSDFGPTQTIRQDEWAALGRQLDGYIESMKALRGVFTQRAGGYATAGDYAAAAEKSISKAKRLMVKAQSDDPEDRDEGETDEDVLAEIDRCLARAKKLLLQAHEADEDTDDAVASLRKAKLARISLVIKSKPAAATQANATCAVTAETVADLDKATGVLKGQLADVIEMLGQRSRSAGMPPNFAMAKAEGAAANDTGIPTHADVTAAIEAGKLDTNQGIEAKSILTILKHGDLEAVRMRRDRSNCGAVRELFANV